MAAYTLRSARSEDMSWIIKRHGSLYAEEFGWSSNFEVLVDKIVSDYQKNFKPGREFCWIAEVDGQNVGCVFVVEESASVAKLRLLMVTEEGRGMGLGRKLVQVCLDFAKDAGYSEMILWTNHVLLSARKIYESFGFQMIAEKEHHDFGPLLKGQTWQLNLNTRSRRL